MRCSARACLFVAALAAVTLCGSGLPSSSVMSRAEVRDARERVRGAFFHAWDAYLAFAYPHDELRPLECAPRLGRTRGYMDDTLGGFSLTFVDSLDTLAIMGEWREFGFALAFLLRNVSFSQPNVVSVFETNIRVVGGLLGAHLIAVENADRLPRGSYDGRALLERARDLAERMLPAFETPTGIPCARVHLTQGAHCDSSEVTTAEAGTLLLEFGALSLLTGDQRFRRVADRAWTAVWRRRSARDMVGTTIDVKTGVWVNSASGIGAGSDSFYEYLLKSFVLFGDRQYLDAFNKAYSAVRAHHRDPKLRGQYRSVNLATGDAVSDVSEGLAMFMPALQVLAGDVAGALEQYYLNFEIVSHVGFPPESYVIREGKIYLRDAGYVLRPEFVESTLMLYLATRDPVFLSIGRKIVDALESFCRTSCGFAAVGDLTTMRLQDRMDSFFLSETLKYLFLLFDAETNFAIQTPHLFTTEAHAFPLLAFPRTDVARRVLSSQKTFNTMCPSISGWNSEVRWDLIRALNPLVTRYSARIDKLARRDVLLTVKSSKFGSVTVPVSPAAFGPALPAKGIRGVMSFASPYSSCSPLQSFPDGAIGVALRGSCFFVDKVKNVQLAGGSCAIISDNVTESLYTMTAMPTEGPRINIPSFMLGKEHADRLVRWNVLGERLVATVHRATRSRQDETHTDSA